MMDLHFWLKQATVSLATTADNAALDAAFLAEYCTGLNLTQQRFQNPELSTATVMALDALLARRMNGEPLAYLIGNQPFYDIEVKVTGATLIPRPDTEHLVEAALSHIPKTAAFTIADIGTGSGAIAIAIAKHRPQAIVIATDKSHDALVVASENAVLNAVKLHFIHADWLIPIADKTLDMVVSNPPYIAPNDPHLAALQYEPITALVAENEGYADLLTIIDMAEQKLKRGGWLLLEHGFEQGERLRQYACAKGVWSAIETVSDYGGNERVTLMRFM